MANMKFLLLLLFYSVNIVLSEDSITSTSSPSEAPATLLPTTKAPIILPTSSKAPITPTTKAPTTQTPTTITPTTPAPTTKAPTIPPSTTTVVPPTTTSVPITTTSVPTTTPAPKPIPSPSTGTWSINDTLTNNTCIVVKMALQMNVNYTKEGKDQHALINLPVNGTKADGQCGNDTQYLNITWNPAENVTYYVVFNFKKNTTEKKIMLSSISARLYTDDKDFPGTDKKTEIHLYYEHKAFETPYQTSYRCDKEQTFGLTSEANGNDTVAILKVSHLQLEAFRTEKNTVFSTAEECDSETPDIIPIAVGCALAGLVVIVLIAYVVGRHRSQARGYLSM